MASKLILISFFCHFISTFVLALDLTKFHSNICVDPSDIKAVSHDFGNISHVESLAVLYPSSADDIVYLVKRAYRSAKGFSVSARGNGHSIHGQAQAANGVVIDMRGAKATQLERRKPVQSPMGSYVDVWGGDLWINVLNWTLPHGLAPKSWTNYLYLTVGGTLSNAGIGGQTYVHGPQTSNVYELDVVTGKGDLITCSKEQNPKLFYGVLGGLGQFGIITRARIALEAAPESVVWIRLTYDDFSVFTKDQEYLISLHEKPASERFDLVLGYFNLNQSRIDYELEVVKYFSKSTDDAVNKEIDVLLAKLNFIPSSITRTSVSYFTFLNRLRQSEFNLRAQGLWNLPHPWLNLLIPKSRIADFDKGVFRGIVGNNSHGKVLVYPVNKNKWDIRTSEVTPDEDIFYAVLFLRLAVDSGNGTQAALDFIVNQNNEILEFCKEVGIKVKVYIPHYNTKKDWKDHYGDKWDSFLKKKMEFDPKHILATGQRIF